MLIRGRNIDLVKTGLIIVAVVAVSSAIWQWYHPKEIAPTTPVVTQEAPKAVEIPKTTITGPKQLVVYERKKFIAKIPVPAEVKDNPANQFTATADIKPSPYGGTAIVFTNMSSGKTGVSYQANKAPFFEFRNVKEISVDYGITSKGLQQGTLGARWTFMRTGIVNWHGRGEISTEPEARAFLGVHAEF